MPISQIVDACAGSLEILAEQFEWQIAVTSSKKTYLNLVNLCGATRTCWHRTASEWWMNRMLPSDIISKMKELTEVSLKLIEEASQSSVLGSAQKDQARGMISNTRHRVMLYDVLLDTTMEASAKVNELKRISAVMEAEQKGLYSAPATGRMA